MAEPGLTQYLIYIVLLLAAGIVTGYAAGLFGIGGGVVLVPVFLTLFPHLGVDSVVLMHCAVGTCLALIVPSALMATRKQLALRSIDAQTLRLWLPWIAVGALMGAISVNLMESSTLKWIFTLYLLSSTVYVAFSASDSGGESGLPAILPRATGAIAIGNLSVWLGIGGGTFAVPFLSYFHYPLKRAIALSSATALAVGTVGAIGAVYHGLGVEGRAPFSLGYIDLLAFIVITPVVMLCAPRGSKLSNTLPSATMKRIYVLFLTGITLYMFIKVL